MAKLKIKFRSGYKYQLAETYSQNIPIKPKEDIQLLFIDLNTAGDLVVKEGYAWDGTSGPIADTDNNMRASLVHDALYQLIRCRKLTQKHHKDPADKLFRNMCKEDGVFSPLATIYYTALKKLGKPATDPKKAKVVLSAPD